MADTRSPFTNAHSHIFTARHAPDFFLKTVIHNTFLASVVDRLVKRRGTRALLRGVHWIVKPFSPNYRNLIERYIEFIEIGTSATQEEEFNMESTAYAGLGVYRIVVLTQVLDYLDYELKSDHRNIFTQVQEVVNLKRNSIYQHLLYPFLGVDPRMQGIDLVKWATDHINRDVGFYGLKIYPAAGFFPFDRRLDELWKWAEEHEVPVMTHSTRGGSFYLGSFESILNSGGFIPQSIDLVTPESVSVMKTITDRIQSLINDPTYHRNNKVWCNIFGHIDNYKIVLEKYPRLKLCFAHLGGADEVNLTNPTYRGKADYPGYLGPNWYGEIKEVMRNPRYENIYSDISYTLSDKDAMKIIYADFEKGDIQGPLMFGTDFYLTQQEPKGDEPDLISHFTSLFSATEVKQLAMDNPERYLVSKIFANP